jgi:hypothetical protein
MRTRAVDMSEMFTFAFLILAMGLQAARPSNAASDNTKPTPLKKVADIPMPGLPVRFDYQSLDPSQSPMHTLCRVPELPTLSAVPRLLIGSTS